ncbi:hypothetical protein ACFO3O_19270 [Dokdonia ponticola]|uniref:Uncharacterized protein n=1 Tax=Dokdonia ponticola TaxID=2041041 RepID=A0ABV9I167_9FLAO
MKKQKSIISFSVIPHSIVVPFLEINNTHVFNPDWALRMHL